MNPREIYVENLESIERIIAKTCRRHCWHGADREDFAQSVHVKLIENDYAVLRKFKGRSSWSTYLTIVISNAFRDFRTEKWGRWRPSAAAQRLGPLGVQLDTLIHRDGLSSREAVEILRTNYGVAESREQLEAIVAKLPARTRRRFEGDDALEHMASRDGFQDGHSGREEAMALERLEKALLEAMSELSDEDWLLMKMRFFDGFACCGLMYRFVIFHKTGR